ncbi:MAG: hypothetical protein JWN86_3802 [Planctomycetota bacterium]|nr:hypothetical protein [Planctomycetota bacterium]
MIQSDTVILCEHCRHELDRRPFYQFCSMLGPRSVICPKCHRATSTDRLEWAEMNLLGKAWYGRKRGTERILGTCPSFP